jgi:hypothetical protein
MATVRILLHGVQFNGNTYSNLYEAYTQPYGYATLRLHLSNVTYKEYVNKCQFSHGDDNYDDDDDDDDDNNNNNVLGTSHIIRKVLQCET